MPTVNVNGAQLYFETTGAGERLVLVHGSWGDARNWSAVVPALAERFEVVTWDRRGHSRSDAGTGPGSLAGDAADLAGLIEHLGGPPAHVVGSSYGASVTLTLVAARPDLVASAAVHEPPLFALLEGTQDAAVAGALSANAAGIAAVTKLLEAGDAEGAARHFVDTVAFGPGAWDRFPEAQRATFVSNASTYLDECRDPGGLSIDGAALSKTKVPLMFSSGTGSPPLFPAVVRELAVLVPAAHVEVLAGAGHVPHVSHPVAWVANLFDFHDGLRRGAPAPAS